MRLDAISFIFPESFGCQTVLVYAMTRYLYGTESSWSWAFYYTVGDGVADCALCGDHSRSRQDFIRAQKKHRVALVSFQRQMIFGTKITRFGMVRLVNTDF